MREPEPPTPEERYAAEHAYFRNHADVSVDDTGSLLTLFTALRDMIEADRAEIGRLTETVNRQQQSLEHVGLRLAVTQGRVAALSATESPTDPETVTAPKSLVDALEQIFAMSLPPKCSYLLIELKREYDAWKAGQG
jgi:hypothetical protein